MTPYWIDTDDRFRIAIVLRPRGGPFLSAALQSIKDAGVDLLVSMLEPDEAVSYGLAEEALLARQSGLEFRRFSIPDHSAPHSFVTVHRFVLELRLHLAAGKSVAVHCMASIGRSSVLLACLMCEEGWTAQEALARLTTARGEEVPQTLEQIRWVRHYAQHLAEIDPPRHA